MKYGTYIEHYYRYKSDYSHYRRCVTRYYTKLCHSRRNNSAILYPKQTCVVTSMQFYTSKKYVLLNSHLVVSAA